MSFSMVAASWPWSGSEWILRRSLSGIMWLSFISYCHTVYFHKVHLLLDNINRSLLVLEIWVPICTVSFHLFFDLFRKYKHNWSWPKAWAWMEVLQQNLASCWNPNTCWTTESIFLFVWCTLKHRFLLISSIRLSKFVLTSGFYFYALVVSCQADHHGHLMIPVPKKMTTFWVDHYC